MKSDTIAAISTGMTNSGIGIIRISGPKAVSVADAVFLKKNGKKLSEMENYTIHYGHIYDSSEVIDEVLVLLMRGKKSYTGEDTIEIDCHGGVYVMQRILETVIKNGARLAEPGEFTKRAFLNGRLDLSQAESVIDVIHAKNDFALKSSMKQLSGFLSSEIKEMRKDILHEIAFLESALDDPEHISLDGYADNLIKIIENQRERIERLLSTSENGKLLKDGISTVIVGKPNAGKSSLLNMLVGEERAIVTEIAGTTRDIIEEQIHLSGILLNIIDTAGIRNTDDIVEKIGVDKAKKYIENADLILYVVDGSMELDQNDFQIMDLLQDRKTILLLNKSDLDVLITPDDILEHVKSNKNLCKIISVSAKQQLGLEELEKSICDLFFSGQIHFNDEICITNIRHKASLREALSSLNLVKRSIEDEMPEDFYSIDLMNAYKELGSIIGEEVEDDLVNEIFSKFCMGK
ncbi:MAG: tRNA uridine-5-carboxymethylaminomethyl(34) synthesis GTPase MnmE [Suilimivivens sp.]